MQSLLKNTNHVHHHTGTWPMMKIIPVNILLFYYQSFNIYIHVHISATIFMSLHNPDIERITKNVKPWEFNTLELAK